MISQNVDDETHSYWQNVTDRLKNELGLKDWVIELQRNGPADETCIAEIGVFYGQRRARLYIDFQCFMAQTPWNRKVTMIHELLHCHFDQRDAMVYDFVNTQQESTHEFFYKTYKRHSEELVETMSQIVGVWMPDFELILGDPPTNSLGY